MRLIKRVVGATALAIFCCAAQGDDLAVSAPERVETAGLTWLDQGELLHVSVGYSGTNGVAVWAKPAGDGTTNLFLTRLTDYGWPIAEPPKLVAPQFFIAAYPELYPAEGGFFLRYFDRTNRFSAPRLVVTRINEEGVAAFAPVVITTNTFKESDSASNGRSMLLLVENYRQNGIELDYTIVGFNGRVVSIGELEGASGDHSFAAASDGKDFLAVWSADGAEPLRVTRFSGIDGSLTTTSLGTNSIDVQVMAHGKNGYLVAGRTSLMYLRDDGTLLGTLDTGPLGTQPEAKIIYPEGEGWIIFTSTSPGGLRSIRVMPTASGLYIQDSPPYPAVSGVFNATFTTPLASVIAPFGPGRFLVVHNLIRDYGISILTRTGTASAVPPLTYARQTSGEVVSSPFGYLTLWTENRGVGYSVRGRRFAPDGSLLDDHSFEVATFYPRVPARNIAFDGKDYIVEWSTTADISLARVSPQGAPDIRRESYSVGTGSPSIYGLNLAVLKGELFGSYSTMNASAPSVQIWKLGAGGQVGPELFVHGFYAVSDGSNLFSIGVNDRSQVFKIMIDPAAANPEITTNIIGTGVSINVAQLRRGFVVRWVDARGDATLAYFSEGQERVRAAAPNNEWPSFADSEDHLLMARLPAPGSRLCRFESFNLQTGARTTAAADLGNVTALRVAGASADFLAIAEAFDAEGKYVAKSWITTAKPPAFAATRVDQSISTTLELNAKRRYRIEASDDLIGWRMMEVVSGRSSLSIDLPFGPQGFVRATLVPE